MKLKLLLVLSLSFGVFGHVLAEDIEQTWAYENLYRAITGFDFYGEKKDVLTEETVQTALDEIIKDPEFLENRVATIVSRLSTENNDPYINIDDYQASLVLAVAQDIDLRTLFTSHYRIVSQETGEVVSSPSVFELREIDAVANLPKLYKLEFSSGKTGKYNEGHYKGLFTTRGFADRFIKDGTNRRPIRSIYDIFLCSKIESYKDSSLSTYYIGPDIDRNPGDNPQNFVDNCGGCHAPMDSQRGAFAYHDVRNNSLELLSKVADKYNRNPKEFGGYITVDDEWLNPLSTPSHMERFGWRTELSGNGIESFAKMVVNSKRFSQCMASRVSAELCGIPEEKLFEDKTQLGLSPAILEFEKSGYKVKSLVKAIARSPLCN